MCQTNETPRLAGFVRRRGVRGRLSAALQHNGSGCRQLRVPIGSRRIESITGLVHLLGVEPRLRGPKPRVLPIKRQVSGLGLLSLRGAARSLKRMAADWIAEMMPMQYASNGILLIGQSDRDRTCDLAVPSGALYQLSYTLAGD